MGIDNVWVIRIGVVLIVLIAIYAFFSILRKLQRDRDALSFKKMFFIDPRSDRETVQKIVLDTLEKLAKEYFFLQSCLGNIEAAPDLPELPGDRNINSALQESLKSKIYEVLIHFHKRIELAKLFRYTAPSLEEWEKLLLKRERIEGKG